MPLPTLIPSSTRDLMDRVPSSASSSSHATPGPDLHASTLAWRTSLASVPDEAFDPVNLPPPRAPALVSAKGPSTHERVKAAVASAKGDMTHPRWDHVINATRLSCTRRNRYFGSSFPTYMEEPRENRVRALVETPEEWLEWERAGKPRAVRGVVRGGTKGKGKKKEGTTAVKSRLTHMREKVQQWQAGMTSDSQIPGVPPQATSQEQDQPARMSQSRIAFKTSKRSSQPTIITPLEGKKSLSRDPTSGRVSLSGVSTPKVTRHRGHVKSVHTDKRVPPPTVLTPDGALPPSNPAKRIQDLSSDSHPAPSFPSQQVFRSTPPRVRRMHSGLSSPPETPEVHARARSSADLVRRDPPSHQTPQSIPPVGSLSLPSLGTGQYSQASVVSKRTRPTTPPGDNVEATPPIKRSRTETLLDKPRSSMPRILNDEGQSPPISGPGARRATPPPSTSPPPSHISAIRYRVGVLPQSIAQTGEPAEGYQSIQTRAQRTPYKPSAECEARAIARAEAGPLPNLSDLLRASTKKARTSKSKKSTSARKAKAAKKLLDEAIPAFTQNPELFKPLDTSILGHDVDEPPPATPCPAPLHPPSSLPILGRIAYLPEPVDEAVPVPAAADVKVSPAPVMLHTENQSSGEDEADAMTYVAYEAAPTDPINVLRSPLPSHQHSQLSESDSSEEHAQRRSLLLPFTQYPDLFAPADASFPHIAQDPPLPLNESHPNETPMKKNVVEHKQPRGSAPMSPIPAFTQQPGLFAPEDSSFNGADRIPSSQPPSQPHHADFLGVGLSPTLLLSESHTLGKSVPQSLARAGPGPGSGGWVPLPRAGSGSWGARVGFGGMPASSQLTGDVDADVDGVSQFMAKDVNLDGWLQDRSG